MIRIFDSNARSFKNNGIKIMRPLTAQIYKKDNADYYIEVTDIVSMFPFYEKGNIIVATTPWGEQGFRIVNIEKRMSKIYVKALHLFYDSANYVINDSYVDEHDCNYALDHLNSACDAKTPFSTYSDIVGDGSLRIVRKSLGEAISEVLNVYGGHLVRDNWDIEVNTNIGQDRGVVISYGKNLKDMTVTEDWSAVCTKIMPYTTYSSADVLLDEVYVTGDVQYDTPYTKCVSFNNELSDEEYQDGEGNVDTERYLTDLKAWLKKQAVQYLKDNSVPQVNYKLTASLQDIADVGDTIVVSNERYGLMVETHVISVKFDCIRQAYKEIEFGNFTNDLKNLISTTQKQATDAVKDATKDVADKAAASATTSFRKQLEDESEKVWSAMGGYVIKEENRILAVDVLPVDVAKNVLIINKQGIGFSNTGVNGTFNGVLSIDGTLDFKSIKTMNLVADLIKGGTLKLGGTTNGAFELYDSAGHLMVEQDRNGIKVFTIDGQTVTLNAEDGLCGYVGDERIWWADGQVFHTYKSETKEITISDKIRFLGIDTDTSHGVGVVVCV